MVKRDSLFKGSYSNSSFQNTKLIRYYFYVFFGKVFYFILLIISIVTMNISISNKSFDGFVREKVLIVSKPVFIIAELPFNLLFDFTDSIKNILLTNIINKDLTEQNIHLKKLYIESRDIKTENENLKKLLNFKGEIEKDYDYISSRVYANPKTGLNNSLILNIGTNDGVVEGNLVLGVNRSVVGRVINVRDGYSDVLLLNDINSRIPARTASTKERIILSGNNRGYLEISYFNSKNPDLIEGDFVYTSGDSDIIPDGFFIGKIKNVAGEFVVEMNENVNTLFNVMVIITKNINI